MKKILVAILMMAPLALSAQKFAHFNSADIIPNMKEYTTAQTEIQNMAKQFDDDLKLMQDELQKKTEEYQKEQANLLENVRQRREQELNDLYQRMQQSYQDNQQSLQKAQQDKMGAIQQLVLDAVKKIGETGGYVYVIDTNAGAIPFVNTALSTDITADVKKAVGIQ
ncbi:MAG: OmpH family outer membrane protein [Paraprevotella sp.]|mgnify:FL=1|nr:OmpH family outer membrane protein [Bacteroidaceae bacterium]MCI6372238.1 OmpH family outer membrane protein [Paraprevotella sp.]MCI6743828.1 OmpH family outer membrane protein [Paraprevotella sp.]MCI7082256.1 OmpH family outer membrane protein [Paraprevotella sp.]MCI7142016.1 OmpH family outer membrane protein [Paraprevotella sp.]